MANDDRVHEFLDRPLTGEWPCLWLDATDLKLRRGGRVISVVAIIAVAVNTDGRREINGACVGPSAACDGAAVHRTPAFSAFPFWTEFLRCPGGRGLDGVKPVLSDAHTGLKAGSILRLIGVVLFEQNDDWQSQHRDLMVEACGQIDTAQTDPLPSIPTQAAGPMIPRGLPEMNTCLTDHPKPERGDQSTCQIRAKRTIRSTRERPTAVPFPPPYHPGAAQIQLSPGRCGWHRSLGPFP